MQGEEKAAGSPCLQSSHIRASAIVLYWVHFADFFTASCHRLSASVASDDQTSNVTSINEFHRQIPSTILQVILGPTPSVGGKVDE
jgi:hypothetical protein